VLAAVEVLILIVQERVLFTQAAVAVVAGVMGLLEQAEVAEGAVDLTTEMLVLHQLPAQQIQAAVAAVLAVKEIMQVWEHKLQVVLELLLSDTLTRKYYGTLRKNK
tara:strand:- start:31 stop:348 length:318 start_codon:yes stop_codon:yes gene_type:complete